MISRDDLAEIAKARLADAQALLDAGRFDGAVYMCGHAVEVALKFKICRTLNWTDFPDKYSNYDNLKTHNLSVLLHWSGVESEVKNPKKSSASLAADWNLLTGAGWGPDLRYGLEGRFRQDRSEKLLKAAHRVTAYLLGDETR